MPTTSVSFSEEEQNAADKVRGPYKFSEFAHMALKEEILRRQRAHFAPLVEAVQQQSAQQPQS